MEAQQTYALPFKNKSVDVITINSMLHHVKDTPQFLHEVDRVLRPNGQIIIAHEPHADFHTHFLLKNQARLWQICLCPRQTITRIARKLKLMPVLESLYYTFSKPKVNNKNIAQKVSAILIQEGTIATPITPSEIKKITDIQIAGFKPEAILPQYTLCLLETYNHLSDDIAKRYNNHFILSYERLLERLFPTSGNQFLMVKQKPSEKS